MYNPLQFHTPVNARFDQAGQMATQIAEQNRVRDERERSLQGFQGLQDLNTLRLNGIPLNTQQQVDESRYGMEALGSPEKFMNYQLQKERAKRVGRRGVTGNAQATTSALQSQNPLVANLTNLERELGGLEQGTPEYKQKYADFQKAITEHDSFAVANNQLWHQKANTRNTEEDFEKNRRDKANQKLKLASYTGQTYDKFRDNWQEQNKQLKASSEVGRGIAPLIKSASIGNAQSVATIVKRMSRMASNEAIVMPELQLGFDASVEGKVDAWADQFIGSGNRIPERDLRNIKVAYNAMIADYNDRLEDSIKDGISDWKSVNPKAKSQSSAKLTRQMMGRDFSKVPDWSDTINYKLKDTPTPTPTPNPSGQSKRGKGALTNSADGIELEIVNKELKKWMELK
jgi:hypothetical protein